MRNSNYTWTIGGGVLAIVDVGPHDQFVTVTNNAENVLEEIKKNLKRLEQDFPKIIIYKDSEGMWDGMEYDGDHLQFYPLQQHSKEDAVRMATERFINFKKTN